jgi:anaerobic magnesium-protoporphyrin IX monomethyl ester cyclase
VFDVAVLGEVEETLRELMALFKATHRFDVQELQKVDGIAFWNDGKIQTTRRRVPLNSLDGIPFRARELLEEWGDPSCRANLYASRGCPFSCKFCSTVQVWGRSMRRHSAGYIADEIEYLRQKYDTRKFFFDDDLFASGWRRRCG